MSRVRVRRERILLFCFQQFAAFVVALVAAPFGLSATVFWMYVCAALLLVIGLARICKELPQEQGVDKIMPFGRLFFAIPIAVFGTEHFTITAGIARMVPRWIPAHTFWVYAVGTGFICAGLSMAVLVRARLAAALVGMTFLIFVCTMDLPGTLVHPGNRFFWALALRELSFGSGALAFAMSPSPAPPILARVAALPRIFIGIASVFYGVEELLHPANMPGIPLEQLSAPWIPGRIVLSYFVGVVLILAGICLVANKKARTAATYLGLTVLLAVLWIYLPMLVAEPKSVVALNYFFDTLFFCGAVLLLANSLEKEAAVAPMHADENAYAVKQTQ